MFFDPVFHLTGAVNRVIVDDEVYPTITLTQEAPEKLQEHRGRKTFFENHEV